MAWVHGNRKTQRAGFLRHLEAFAGSCGVTSSESGFEIDQGYMKRLAEVRRGLEEEEEEQEEEESWERELVKLLVSHVGKGDRLGLKS